MHMHTTCVATSITLVQIDMRMPWDACMQERAKRNEPHLLPLTVV